MAKIRMCRQINRRVVAFLSAFILMLGGGGGTLQVNAAVTKDTAPFTYTGTWDITEYAAGKYYARLLTNGILTPKSNMTADIFIVNTGAAGKNGTDGGGKGGNGGNGGNGSSNIAVSLTSGTPYNATISTATNLAGCTSNTGTKYTGGTGGTGYGGSGATGGTGGAGYAAFGGDVAPFTTMFYGGGGGGGVTYGTVGAGGKGGGGAGGKGTLDDGYAGSKNTGGAGGGGGGAPGSSSTEDKFGRGGSGGSGIIIIRGDLEGVGAPISITTPANIQINNQYTISWGASTTVSATVSGYILERQIDNGQWIQVYSGSARSCTQSLVKNQANTVRYRVKAYGVGSISGGALESGYTTGDIRSVINNSAPTAPLNITVPYSYSRWSNTPLQISWGAAEDKDGDAITYIVECVRDNSNTFTVLGVQSGRTYAYANTFTGASLNIRFRVKARDSNNSDSGYVESPWVIIKQDTEKPTIQFSK